MATKAQAGLGSTIKIGSTAIGEVQSVKQSGAKWDTDEATNFASTVKEFVATIQDWGEFAVEAKRVSTDAGQLAVVAAFGTGATTAFTITLLKEAGQSTTGDSYSFNAIVTECDFSLDVNKLTPFSFKLKVSGAVTYTEGA
jgi:hypothetical protein